MNNAIKRRSNIKKSAVVWLQISAGQGPRECGWVVTQLMMRILQSAESHGCSAEIVEKLAFDKSMRKQDLVIVDAYLSCLIRLEGVGVGVDVDVESFAQSWQGAIKWQGESPYRPKHKRLNWFVGVECVENAEVKSAAAENGRGGDLKQLAREVNVETMRASGAGGQHVNKTSSAVRITHRPSGLQVRVESDRSQHRNRQLGMERLQMLLAQELQGEGRANVRERWLKHYNVERGRPVRTFSGESFTEQ